MHVGDFIEDTYKSFNGEIVAVLRGVITEVAKRRKTVFIKYHCSQVHYGDSEAHNSMLGQIVHRNARNITVLSSCGGKVVQNGS